MKDREPFIRTICERPEQDGPRLVYADWLEEHGDPRGEFIRVQIELSQKPPMGLKEIHKIPMLFGEEPIIKREFHRWGKGSEWDKKQKALRLRESEIWDCHGADWFNELGVVFANSTIKTPHSWSCGFHVRKLSGHPIDLEWSRGFLGRVSLPWADWRDSRLSMIQQPIQKVKLTTRPELNVRRDGGAARYSLPGFEAAVTLADNGDGRRVAIQALLKEIWPSIEFDVPNYANGFDRWMREERPEFV